MRFGEVDAGPVPFGRAEPSVEELVRADLEFHRGIVRASGNTVLSSLPDGLSGPAARARMWRAVTRQDAAGRTLHGHRAIPAALRDRDVEAARSWATVHIAGAERWLGSALRPDRTGRGGRPGFRRAGWDTRAGPEPSYRFAPRGGWSGPAYGGRSRVLLVPRGVAVDHGGPVTCSWRWSTYSTRWGRTAGRPVRPSHRRVPAVV
ncbi:FCD domain-containing protein [Streptomyces marianii]|uniref:FCD domain-containing protein n=1 Tax=Streptomyces marianii TaxID=1817406 RepID=A0A5R9EJJ7_9ACTN|nr:FCD domain-containing protein [Streptomyces marianii]